MNDDAQIRLALAVNHLIDASDALAEAMKGAPECGGQAQVTVKSGEDAKTVLISFRFISPYIGFRLNGQGAITGFAVYEEGQPHDTPSGYIFDLTEGEP